MAKGIELDETQKALIRKYAHLFSNKGGNDVIELIEREVRMEINMPVAVLQVACSSQAALLFRLNKEGHLK